MKKQLLLITILISNFTYAQFNQVNGDITPQGIAELNGNSVALDHSGDFMAIGAPLHLNILSNEVGVVRVYQNNSGTFNQIGSDIEGSVIGAEFGSALDINNLGARVVIGSPEDPLGGVVKVYEYNGSVWSQLGSDITGPIGGLTGYSVSINKLGNIIAIGEPLYNDGVAIAAGRTRVFEWNGSAWSQIGADITGEFIGDNSGWDIALNDDGDVLAIGAPLNPGSGVPLVGAGQVRVFGNSGGVWTQIGTDIEGDNTIQGNVGWSVDLDESGNNLIVGAPLGIDISSGIATGNATIFNFSGSWNQVGNQITGLLLNDQAGWDVSINGCGGRVAVGSPLSDTNGSLLDTGNVKIFDNIAGVWRNVNSNNDIQGDGALEQYGWSVSISELGDKIFAGAPLNSLGGEGRLHVDSRDIDGDGVLGFDDVDNDNDGIPDVNEKGNCQELNDTDGDGIPDYLDLDSDNDGILDVDEGGNGLLDTNNDGMINNLDAGFLDGNSDGQSDNSVDATEDPDTDGDGVPDYQDLDSDNDGINDVIEGGNDASDTNQDGIIDGNDTGGNDNDNDGIPDSTDGDASSYGDLNDPLYQDSDSDGIPDSQDLDSDDDGVLDVVEANNSDADTNDDGVIDSDDTNGADTDGDGIPNSIDQDPTNYGDAGNTSTSGNNSSDPTDSNSGGSGVIADSGTDNDNDGIADSIDDCDNIENILQFGLCNATLSIEDIRTNTEFNIYPNPVNSSMYIINKNSTDIEIKLYDLSGKILLQKSFQGTTNNLKLNLNHLKTGLYQLSIKTNNSIYFDKIVKK